MWWNLMRRIWQPKGVRTPEGVYLPPVAGGADWPLFGGQRFSTEGEDLTDSGGTEVTSGAANTKGSYVELVASSSFDAQGILVCANSNTFVAFKAHLLDIAVGAAASEQIILPDLLTTDFWDAFFYGYFPISIPSGTRISARCQSDGASAPLDVTVTLLAQGFLPSSPLSRVEAWGVDAATSRATSIDPGGSADTKGSWAELVASTAFDARGILVATVSSNIIRADSRWLLDIATGAGGSEQVLLGDFMLIGDDLKDQIRPAQFPFLPVYIPAGSRVAVRTQCTITDATDRLFQVAIYGVG